MSGEIGAIDLVTHLHFAVAKKAQLKRKAGSGVMTQMADTILASANIPHG